ncbi:MAG TPA: hypothetical protein DCS93_12790 [Microscillaceae bacterium]|nr:hypothetical protein [Microscillaceae bacterium]
MASQHIKTDNSLKVIHFISIDELFKAIKSMKSSRLLRLNRSFLVYKLDFLKVYENHPLKKQWSVKLQKTSILGRFSLKFANDIILKTQSKS